MINYKITRFEQTGDYLFICINSLNNPVYLEYWFLQEERVDKTSKEATIEKLLARLEILDEKYITPVAAVSKLSEVNTLVIDVEKVAEHKVELQKEK